MRCAVWRLKGVDCSFRVALFGTAVSSGSPNIFRGRPTLVTPPSIRFAAPPPGRADRTRTCNLRFWRPLLYQLSYSPRSWREADRLLALARLAMQMMRAAARAELLQFEPRGIVTAIFLARVVSLSALRALERDHDPVGLTLFCHSRLSSIRLALGMVGSRRASLDARKADAERR